MIKEINDEKPPIRNVESELDLEQRKKDIETISKLKVDQAAEFTSKNINSFKTAFYSFIRGKKMSFTFRKVVDKENTYKVWRIE